VLAWASDLKGILGGRVMPAVLDQQISKFGFKVQPWILFEQFLHHL
jgi:hypothetical protein